MTYTFLGEQEDGSRLLLSPSQRAGHLAIFGISRSGKTELLRHIASQDIAAGHSVIVFDPACDSRIFSSIYETAEQVGRLDDLVLLSPSMPEYSISIDPLAKSLFSADQIANNLLSLWGRSWDNSASPFVQKTFRMAVAAAGVFNTHDDGGRQHILNVLKRIGVPEEMCHLLASWFRNSAAVFKPGSGNLPLERLQAGKNIILVILPDTTGDMATGRVFLNMLLGCLKNLSINPRTPIAIHLDEARFFANLVAIAEMLEGGNHPTAWISTYFEDPAQIYRVLNTSYANALLDKLATKVIFRSSAPSTVHLARTLFSQELNEHELTMALANQVPGQFYLHDGTQWQAAAPIETGQTIGLPFPVVHANKKALCLREIARLWKRP